MVNSNILASETYFEDMVSVIIPVYNAEKYIDEAIKSVLEQTYDKIEIIVVDDCSSDNSLKKIKNIKDERIRIIRLETNSGAGIARNTGVMQSRGRYIAFLDSDDLWHPLKVEEQLKMILEKNACFLYTALQFIDENGKFLKKQSVPKKMTFRDLLRNTAIATSSVMLDCSIVAREEIFMPNRKTGEDYVLWLSLLKKYGKALGINDPLTFYRKLDNSLSSNKFKAFGDLWYGQHIQNKIAVPIVFFNFFCFALHAIKKHYL